ncbi:hypothetical protein MHUMG1_09431 [Metarhizium humberi]|uniref:Uncharacterized protein n=1 Tax=Metarhizium humberi TaxID=2596975 RepID=A0A9P8S2T0_9HYPO|nr:hypothetical protein MHUMG1_09431 [Metarhizium humberi]
MLACYRISSDTVADLQANVNFQTKPNGPLSESNNMSIAQLLETTKLPRGQHYEAINVGDSYKRADTRLGWSKSFRNMAHKLKIRRDTQSAGLALLETCKQ